MCAASKSGTEGRNKGINCGGTMVEELFSVLALGLEISVWLFITCMVLIKRRRRSIWMRLLSLFMIVGYFEIYEVLMFIMERSFGFIAD